MTQNTHAKLYKHVWQRYKSSARPLVFLLFQLIHSSQHIYTEYPLTKMCFLIWISNYVFACFMD